MLVLCTGVLMDIVSVVMLAAANKNVGNVTI